jgi:hypothetical protein
MVMGATLGPPTPGRVAGRTSVGAHSATNGYPAVWIEEVPVGRLIGILLVVWLVIGGIAAFQRGYFDDTRTNCSEAGDIALTVVAGPLNYFGVNPKVKCADVNVPEPSK